MRTSPFRASWRDFHRGRPGIRRRRLEAFNAVRWAAWAFLLAALGLLTIHRPAHAATNSALGGIGGLANGTLLGGDGTGTATVTLEVTDLGFVKQSRDLTGAVLPDSATVSAEQLIWFVLYVDNPTSHPAEDLQLTDSIDESQFTYVPGTLATADAPSGSDDATLWAAAWSPLTDGTGAPDDAASVSDTGGPSGPDRVTVGAVPAQTNQSLGVPGLTRRAIRFQVRVR
jgi:hypothetical protein